MHGFFKWLEDSADQIARTRDKKESFRCCPDVLISVFVEVHVHGISIYHGKAYDVELLLVQDDDPELQLQDVLTLGSVEVFTVLGRDLISLMFRMVNMERMMRIPIGGTRTTFCCCCHLHSVFVATPHGFIAFSGVANICRWR